MKVTIITALLALLLLGAIAAPASAGVSYREAKQVTDKGGKRVAFRFDAVYQFGGCVRFSNVKLTCKALFYGWRETDNSCHIFVRVYERYGRNYSSYKTGSCR